MAGNFLAKTIGLAAIGIAGYDSFATANRQSSRITTAKQLERINDVYLRTDSLDSESAVASGMQKWARNWHMSDNFFFRAFDKTTSYFGSLFSQLGNNIITLGLGATALLCGKGKFSKIKIPFVGKFAATLLALQAGKFVLVDLLGFGASDPRRTNFK